jgi:hypothetical protein
MLDGRARGYASNPPMSLLSHDRLICDGRAMPALHQIETNSLHRTK